MKRGLMFLLMFFGFLGWSCRYDHVVEPSEIQEEVSFSRDVVPIFENNCTSCHSQASITPVLLRESAFEELSTKGYLNIDSPAESKLMMKVNSGHPNELVPTSYEKLLLLTWMAEGAMDN